MFRQLGCQGRISDHQIWLISGVEQFFPFLWRIFCFDLDS